MNTDQTNNNQANSRYATPFDVDNYSGSNYSSLSFFQKVSSLPDSIKNIMADPSTTDFIEDTLGPNFKLTNNQKTEITRIIRDVLLADLFIGEMAQSISVKAKLAPDEAKGISDLIVSELFGPAIEDIKRIQAQIFTERVNKPTTIVESRPPKIPERPDLKVDPDINRNNIVDLRNK